MDRKDDIYGQNLHQGRFGFLSVVAGRVVDAEPNPFHTQCVGRIG